MKVSILDVCGDPHEAIELSLVAERLGFSRYWVGEHHCAQKCPNSLLVATLMAGYTETIRVGTGATSVMFRNPWLIAEDARIASALFGDRFDLGLAPAASVPPKFVEALNGGQPLDMTTYIPRIRRIHECLTGRPRSADSSRYLLNRGSGPPVWLLGTKSPVCSIAGELGVGLCSSLHYGATLDDASNMLSRYRNAFVPSAEFAEPRTILVVSGVCAPTATESHRLMKEVKSGASPEAMPSRLVEFCGTGGECIDQLETITRTTGADEIMILSFVLINKVEVNTQMYTILSEALGLVRSTSKPSAAPTTQATADGL